jgi:type IV pilus assembly protein PilO
MALGLPTDQRSQVMLLLTVVAAFLLYVAWDGLGINPFAHAVRAAQIDSMRTEADSLQAIVDAAKRDLASGSIEDLRRRVAEYGAALELMRRLVPDGNEVPALMDDISTKAKVRGITLGQLVHLSPEPGRPFDTYRYRIEVYGHYDQIGEFLADIASLPRIVVPQDVILSPARQAAQRLLGDTLGSLLLAEFSIRTYVKSAAPPPAAAQPAGGSTPARNE